MRKQYEKLWKHLLALLLVITMLPVYSITTFAAKQTEKPVLDETVELELREAFLTYLEHNDVGYEAKEYELEELQVEEYYGEYNGYHIALMGFVDWVITSDMAYVTIGDYKFAFGSSCYPPCFLAYKAGEMVKVKNAYEQGLLSDDDMQGIAAVFGAIDLWNSPFTDVTKDDWYYESVKYAYGKNLFFGLTENTFGSDEEMTRAMLTTVLWRYAGSPTGFGHSFNDVQDGAWYTQAIAWGAANKIVYGLTEDTFAPDETVTREQIMAILHRYAKQLKGEELKPEVPLKGFEDQDNISGWAYESMNWAQENGLIYGRYMDDKFCIAPLESATRAEVAAFLMRFVEYMD